MEGMFRGAIKFKNGVIGDPQRRAPSVDILHCQGQSLAGRRTRFSMLRGRPNSVMDDRTSSKNLIEPRPRMYGERIFSMLKTPFGGSTEKMPKADHTTETVQTKPDLEPAPQNIGNRTVHVEKKSSDAYIRGIRRIFADQIPQVSFEGFLHFHHTQSGHGRSRLAGRKWKRVWCALGDGRLHIVQNVPSQLHVLLLKDYMIQGSAATGSNALPTFAVVALGETRTASEQQRFLFKAASIEERGNWLSALKKITSFVDPSLNEGFYLKGERV